MSETPEVEHEVAPRQVGKFLLWTGVALVALLVIVMVVLQLTGHKLPFM